MRELSLQSDDPVDQRQLAEVVLDVRRFVRFWRWLGRHGPPLEPGNDGLSLVHARRRPPNTGLSFDVMSALLPNVAVVTVSYNSSSQLEGFLSSIDAQTRRPAYVLIADNASRDVDRTRDIARAGGAEVLELGTNRGYGSAVNAAIAALPDSITEVLISNPDVELTPDSLDVLSTALDVDPTVGAVGPRILDPDGTVYPSGRNLPSLRTGIGHAFFSRSWPSNPWTRSYRAETATSLQRRTVGWLSGSCLFVRRSAFEEIGGFDEGYFMYFEDVDLGYRLNKAGWRSDYEPGTSVTHVGGLSTANESERMIKAHHDSASRYLQRKYSGWLLSPLRWSLRLGLRLRAWYLIRRHAPR
ncbi:glycosyltransferase family 2 protein [Agromyces bauzanensis]